MASERTMRILCLTRLHNDGLFAVKENEQPKDVFEFESSDHESSASTDSKPNKLLTSCGQSELSEAYSGAGYIGVDPLILSSLDRSADRHDLPHDESTNVSIRSVSSSVPIAYVSPLRFDQFEQSNDSEIQDKVKRNLFDSSTYGVPSILSQNDKKNIKTPVKLNEEHTKITLNNGTESTPVAYISPLRTGHLMPNMHQTKQDEVGCNLFSGNSFEDSNITSDNQNITSPEKLNEEDTNLSVNSETDSLPWNEPEEDSGESYVPSDATSEDSEESSSSDEESEEGSSSDGESREDGSSVENSEDSLAESVFEDKTLDQDQCLPPVIESMNIRVKGNKMEKIVLKKSSAAKYGRMNELEMVQLSVTKDNKTEKLEDKNPSVTKHDETKKIEKMKPLATNDETKKIKQIKVFGREDDEIKKLTKESSVNHDDKRKNRKKKKSSATKDNKKKRTKKSSAASKTSASQGQKIKKNIDFHLTTKKAFSDKRVYDKLHQCTFCSRKIFKIGRHIELVHRSHPSVASALLLDRKDPIRINKFTLFVNEGDFYHNCAVLSCGEGELILKKSPTELEKKIRKPTDYAPCPDCLGFMLKTSMTKHVKTCPGMDKDKLVTNESKTDFRSRSDALLGIHSGINIDGDFYQHVVCSMRDDEIAEVCKNDTLILNVGAFLFDKFDISQSEYIRQSMRMLARLLMEIKDVDIEIESLDQCFNPKNFNNIITAVKNLCIAEKAFQKRLQFQKATLVLKLGPLIKKAASLYRGICLRRKYSEDEIDRDFYDEENKKTLDFLGLMNMEWKVKLSSGALANMKQKKFRSGMLLPLTEDLVKLRNHINDSTDKLIEQLEASVTVKNYRLLLEMTLCNIILFNKRRSGEAAKMVVNDYLNRPKWNGIGTEQIKESLTPLEHELGSKMVVCKIVGKLERIVDVILTPQMQKAVECLIKFRDQSGVKNCNEYLFAIPNHDKARLRGHDCLKKLCKELDLKAANLINGTALRKYVATVVQVLGLSENETDWLARHLGHDIRVHRDFYRLHDTAIEATKISRLLLAVDTGKLKKFAGKSINDINLDDLPSLEAECDELEQVDQLEMEDAGETEIGGHSSNNATMEVPDAQSTPEDTEAPIIQNESITPEVEENIPQEKETFVKQNDNATLEGGSRRNNLRKRKAAVRKVPVSRMKCVKKNFKKATVESDPDYDESEEDDVSCTKIQNVNSTGKTKKQVHVPWTPDEQRALLNYFQPQIRKLAKIGFAEALKCIEANPVLKSRSKEKVKTFYFNYLKKMKKMMAK